MNLHTIHENPGRFHVLTEDKDHFVIRSNRIEMILPGLGWTRPLYLKTNEILDFNPALVGRE